MSVHVLVNLLNLLGKTIRCETLPSILPVFHNEFNKFNNTGARMQDSIYHTTLKSQYISKFCTKRSRFRHEHYQFSSLYNGIPILYKLNSTVVTI